MKKVKCSYKGCNDRRLHFEKFEQNRNHQMVEVPDDFNGKAYCSIECQMYDVIDDTVDKNLKILL